MKKGIRILVPILLALAIIFCTIWYLFVYDRAFTRDMLLNCARYSESQGKHELATHFYNAAYAQSGNSDAVAIELAEQYKSGGNYTKAEFTLSKAIANGGGVDVYIALCKTYLEQDKLLDAVNMLNGITNTEIKAQIDAMRPTAPVTSPEPGFYRQYISVTVEASSGTLYATGNGVYPSLQDTPYAAPIALGDGENTIYALTVADNGLVSPLTISGYTIGGIVEKMEFSDEAMETAIREALTVSQEKELYTNDLWNIKEFVIPEAAQSYAELKHMVFLEKLTIQNGVSAELSNLASLATLTDLTITGTTVTKDHLAIIGALPLIKNLTLSNCEISNIAPLEKTITLVKLDLNHNSIRTLTALSGMQQLQELNLSNNTVVDLSPIGSCNALTSLDISSNAVSTLAPLSGLRSLSMLNASNNVISTLGDLSGLANLAKLYLGKNKLTNIAPISVCTALQELEIASNLLTDINDLSQLMNLTYLDFSYNEVAQIPQFSKDCALVTINGSHNKISSLKPLGGLRHLNNVHMDYNAEISSVDVLADCPLLIEVNVYATKVTDVTALTNQSVIVHYNPIQED